MNDEKKYKDALERARECMKDGGISQNTIDYLCNIFPELAESEDEKIRKQIISFLKEFEHDHYRSLDFSSWIAWLESLKDRLYLNNEYDENMLEAILYCIKNNRPLEKEHITWLEKQGKQKYDCSEEDEKIRKRLIDLIYKVYANTNYITRVEHEQIVAWLEKQVPVDEEKMQIGARKDVASSIITYLDRNTLGMCLSNMECEDLVNAVVDSDWGKVYDYMKKKLEKQDESKVSEPNWCHHKVDLSAYSEEYRKAYYDGWNNCNIQHSQCNEERNDVVKCLINGMKFYYEDNEDATWGTDKWSMPVKHIIEVLEKQGEHKSVDKVEPKFQNGQWVVWQNKCYKVNYNGCGYELIDQNGLTTSCEYGTIDENAHLWTIEDAKDGDVLIVYGLPFIYCCFDDYQGNYCCIDPNGEFRTTFNFGFNGKTILPATKEQRDILFSKMKEAGYEWNAEKKEIKKIES